jgi:hypothetical protein
VTSKKKVLIFGIPIFFLLGVISIPNLIRPRVTASKITCLDQLRMIDGMKNQWALEHQKTTNDVPTWDDLRGYLAAHLPLQCPDGGVYSIGRVGLMPSCSFAGHDESWKTNSP